MLSGKSLSLLAGVFQQATLVLIIRYSKTLEVSTPYITSVVVWSAELFKMVLSLILEHLTSRPSNSATNGASANSANALSLSPFGTLRRLFSLNRESIKLVVPAILYLIQNNLLFYALSNLSVPTYQVTNQGKLLTTAIISRIMLKKRIFPMQYLAIALLGLGVAFVHLSEYQESQKMTADEAQKEKQMNQWLGLMAVLISCCTSGFAGVYFELLLKTDKGTNDNVVQAHPQSVHTRNFQLAFYSIAFCTFHIITNDLPKLKADGPFQGFNGLVLVIIVMQGMTGFVVSMMLKYADAILKGFSTSIAIVLATVVSLFVFDSNVNEMFWVGALMVGSAVKMYSHYGKKNGGDTSLRNASLSDRSRSASSSRWSRTRILRLTILTTGLVYFFFSITYAMKKPGMFENSDNNASPALKSPNLSSVPVEGKNLRPDLTMYDPLKSTPPVDHKKITTSTSDANCLFFNCTRDVNECDNNNPTEYDGEKPPCCVHIMRDAGRLFDAEMSRIGLDYFAAFGTLLGFMRSDRVIPWTGDLDYIIPSKAVANAMVHLWDTKKTGLAHVFLDMNRMCITRDFADGKLAKFNFNAPAPTKLWIWGFPNIDLYVGKDHPEFPGEFNEYKTCRHKNTDVFPTQKALFYNNTLSQRLPANPEQLLRTYYGRNWRIPRSDHKTLGDELVCPYSPTH